MAAQKSWHLVCYDVREPRRLRKTAKILEGFGERLQESVFRCYLSDRQLERLRWELSKVMAEEDELLVVPLCASCVSRLKARRKQSGWPEEPSLFEVV